MAHSNRDKRKALRLAQKRARKAAWASLIGTSQNKKTTIKGGTAKRRLPMAKVPETVPAMVKGKLATKVVMVHQGPVCHNVGCKRCSLVARKAA